MRTTSRRAGAVAAAAAALTVCAGVAIGARQRADEGGSALQQAIAVMGVDKLQTLRLMGHGSDFLFGQAYDPSSPWPRFHLPSYQVEIDYGANAWRDERVRRQAEDPPRGGGNQPIDEQRQVWAYRDDVAWNGDAADASVAGPERDRRPAAEARLAWIWLTPHGFLRAARAGSPRVSTFELRGERKTRITLEGPGRLTYQGTIDATGRVERVETWLSSPVLGDTHLEAAFYGYRDEGGVLLPSRVVHREGGYPILDVEVKAVVNPPLAITVPPRLVGRVAPAQAGEPSLQLAPGVWRISAGARDRVVAVEFADHVIVVEAPQGEPESVAVIDEVKRLIPGKPIRYVINTHIHFDHSGGLRAYAAIGATVVTHRDNVPYYEQVWANRWSVKPDRLAASGARPHFIGVVGSRTFADATHSLVVYHYAGNDHHPGMLMVHLPAERILIEADSFNPPNDPAERPNAVPNLAQFYAVVQRLRLDVDILSPTHGRLTTMAEARDALARFWPGPID
jgi:glyoxylase-like metal-dependent hydrolase (beta-lactamase superfamily II)